MFQRPKDSQAAGKLGFTFHAGCRYTRLRRTRPALEYSEAEPKVQECKYPVCVFERSQCPDGVANVLRGEVGQLMQSMAAQQGKEV